MRYFNKLASAFSMAAVALLMLSGCESSELYQVGAPSWLEDKIDSIKEANKPMEEVLEGMEEDVYTVGKTDFSSTFWQSFSKYYRIGIGTKWNAVINLHINPSDQTKYFQNFVLILSNDVDRGADGYLEYGAIRYDNAPTGNSEWGNEIDRSLITGNLVMSPVDDIDENIQKLGGSVVLTVDRSRTDTLIVRMNNGTVVKQYTQPYQLANHNTDPTNDTIRCFLVADGSYFDFQESNVEPIGGYTSAEDKQPVSMTLHNVPTELFLGDDLAKVMAGVTADVVFEGGQAKSVTAADLTFNLVPDANTAGEKTLVVLYNKTFKGENADKPIMAESAITVKDIIKSIRVVQNPAQTHYENVFAGYPFIPAGMVVEGVSGNGTVSTVSYDRLSFSAVPASVGTHQITISTESGATATVEVTVGSVIASTLAHPTPTVLGEVDNSLIFWAKHIDADINVPSGQSRSVRFTNYSSKANNYNNFVVVLRGAAKNEYAVVRADNFGWGAGYDGNPDLTLSGGQADWDTWRNAMDGAKVAVCVTNRGNGMADVRCAMVGNDGNFYYQDYQNIHVTANDLFLDLTIDGCHLVFD